MTEMIRKKRRRIKRKAWLALLFIIGVPLGFLGAITYERLTHVDGYALFVDGEHFATLDSQTKIQDLIQIHTDHYKSSYRLPYDAKVEIFQDIKIEEVRVLKGGRPVRSPRGSPSCGRESSAAGLRCRADPRHICQRNICARL